MTDQDIRSLLRSLRAVQPKTELAETHISWVFLQPEYAFKVKKALAFTFLDFSTPEKRLSALLDELRLNRRLAPEVYLEVVGGCETPEGFAFFPRDACPVPPVDHALRMKRLDNKREMHVLLEQGSVEKSAVRKLAHKMARFHLQTERVTDPEFRPKEGELFRDLASIGETLALLGIENAVEKINAAIHLSDRLWSQFETLLDLRHASGCTLDGHGDLHSGNIFLLDEPVIFDCIEFDAHLRILDVLSELAFLAADLVSYGREDLADDFLNAYQELNPVMKTPNDQQLYTYYIWYRLNVRLKVTALKAPDSGFIPASERKRILQLWEAFVSWPFQGLEVDGTL